MSLAVPTIVGQAINLVAKSLESAYVGHLLDKFSLPLLGICLTQMYWLP
jgi:Na+-driven multidrug efflux pump